MKASSAIMHTVYALAVAGAVLFIALGIIPTNLDLDEMPLDIRLEAESTYDVDEPIGMLEHNFSDAVNKHEGPADAYTSTGTKIPNTTIYPNNGSSVTNSVAKVKDYAASNPGITSVTLKGSDGTVLTQSMIMKNSNGIVIEMYTEALITNGMRYDLLDVEVGIEQVNNTGTVSYDIVTSAPTTIASGDTTALPIEITINSIDMALVILSGSEDNLDVCLGISITGKYFYGFAGASVYAQAIFESPATPSISISATKISLTSTEPIDILPNVSITGSIGDIDFEIVNGSGGFQLILGDDTVNILDKLREQYDGENYEITIGAETFVLTQEEYAGMIDLMEQVMMGGGVVP